MGLKSSMLPGHMIGHWPSPCDFPTPIFIARIIVAAAEPGYLTVTGFPGISILLRESQAKNGMQRKHEHEHGTFSVYSRKTKEPNSGAGENTVDSLILDGSSQRLARKRIMSPLTHFETELISKQACDWLSKELYTVL